jgi:hypothetical protein
MASYTWTSGVSGDWATAADWTPNGIPDATTADVTIDAPATQGAYTVTIAAGESETVNSLSINGVNNRTGSNSNPYDAAKIEIDGTLIFGPTSDGVLGSSLQTFMLVNGGTLINAGTIDAFIQASGNVLFTGTNGFYVTNWLQSLAGTVTVDTSSIAEMTGNTLFDGIYEAKGPGSVIKLGGSIYNDFVSIATIEGPPLIASGWTELLLNDPTAEILEWQQTGTYATIESTLTNIGSRGTLDVLAGRNYDTTNTLTIASQGLLNLQAGVVTTGGIDINGGAVQGYGTIASGMVNNGTLMAVGGTLDVQGNLTGTGVVKFDYDQQTGQTGTVGATFEAANVSAGQTIMMNGHDTLVLTAPSVFAGTIEAGLGDTIILQGVTGAAASGTLTLSGTNTLTISQASGPAVTLNVDLSQSATTSVANQTDGSSYQFSYNPNGSSAEVITHYSSLDATGTMLSATINTTDGTNNTFSYVTANGGTTLSFGAVTGPSLLYAYNPTGTVKQTVTQYSGANDTGTKISAVVDNTDGTSLIYAYNPTSTASLTVDTYSATDSSNGAPAGNRLSTVVDNTDGTSLLYSYNPSDSVKLTVSTWSATDPTNGAPTGTEISDIVSNNDGSTLVYAYNPTSAIALTATLYSATNTDGSPAGSLVSQVANYNNGESSVASYQPDGSSSTAYYSGPNGSGTPISGITPPASGLIAASAMSTSSDTITITGANQLVDPGAGAHTIQFASGATSDTLVLYQGSSDQVMGFDPSVGDKLDLSGMLAQAGVDVTSSSFQLSNYVSVQNDNGSAAVLFDPTGHSVGSQVALLVGDGGLTAQLQTLAAFKS